MLRIRDIDMQGQVESEVVSTGTATGRLPLTCASIPGRFGKKSEHISVVSGHSNPHTNVKGVHRCSLF
jgi:hypothetical protein